MDDVAIVGAGPAGSLSALLLARAGFRVRVFERARFPRPKLCGDTLNPGACRTLARHLPIAALTDRARALDGMLLTGPSGVAVRGCYGRGINGYAVERRVFDQWLLDQAAASGVRVEENCRVVAPIVSDEKITGVQVRGRAGSTAHPARIVIAADGAHSTLAFGLKLAHHPKRPRRWAIGAYFTDVDGLFECGEMHIRRGHYIGVAPMPSGLANACLVVPHDRADDGWRNARMFLMSRLAMDARLRPRFARARMVEAPAVLGPMAVDTPDVGVPGLLLAGDAAGFIDPMTGDGLTFALRGAELAAEVVTGVLSGRLDSCDAPLVLRQRRYAAFRNKYRFNRALRQLVASPIAVSGAAIAAHVTPAVFEQVIRYAGDVPRR